MELEGKNLLDLRLYYKAAVIKTVWLDTKTAIQISGTK